MAGNTYFCNKWNDAGISFNHEIIWQNSVINWHLKRDYEGITVIQTDATQAQVIVDKNAHTGFILCADYIHYTDSNKTTIETIVSAEKKFKVASEIDVKPVNTNSQAKKGEEYLFKIEMKLYDENGNLITMLVSNKDTVVTFKSSPWYVDVKAALDDVSWKFISLWNTGELTINVWLQTVSGTIFGSNYGATNNNFIKDFVINVT